MNAALHFSVTCAEDVPRITPPASRSALAGAARRGALAERALAVCDVWPRGTAPADAATPVASDMPVLILSGGLDPVTPPAYGAEVAKDAAEQPARRRARATATSCRRTRAGRASIARVRRRRRLRHAARRPASTHFEKSARPPLWPDRLGAAP